jgi:Zn ribbon nucleic-acid-binding protein
MAKCPKCGKRYAKGKGALSRRDNKTEICSDCGFREAIEDAERTFAIKENKKVVKNNE